MVAKVAGAANLFLTVPFVLDTLGPAQFGVWATLVSLVTFAGFLDFGLGNGTMNLIAAANGRGANHEVGSIVREGHRTVMWITLWLGMAVLIALPLVPWHRLVGMPEAMAGICRASAAAVLLTIVLAVPLNLANRVQLGLGRGASVFRWQAIGQVLTAAMVIFLAQAGASLVVLVGAAVASPLVSSVANTWLLWRDPMVATSAENGQRPDIAAQIRREGLLFFVLQLAAALAFSSDLPLISALRSPTEAGSYAIVQRLFSVIPIGLAFIWVPLWPVYRHALAAGDHVWVARTLRRSILFAVLLATCSAAALGIGFEWIAGVWVQKPIVVGGMLLVGMGVWCVIDAAGTAIATFLNAASVMRYQVIIATVFAVSCITLKAWAIVRFGTWIVPWVTAAVFLVANLIPTLLLRPRIMAHAFTKTY